MALVATGKQLLNPEKILGEQVGITTGQKVADLGCGHGFFALTAARLVGGRGQVYAVDILKSALEMVEAEARRQQILNLTTVWSNIEMYGATKIPAESLDVALIIHTIYQLDNVKAFLQEAARLVKSGGKVVIIDWEKGKSPLGPPEENRKSAEEVKEYASQINELQEAELFNPGQYHYGLIYKKV